MINLYFDSKNKIHYFNDLTKECDACGELITDTIIVRAFWDKIASGVNYLCFKCKNELKKSNSATYTDTIRAIVDAEVPPKAIPFMFNKPDLQCTRNIMVFDAANNLEGEKVKDKTVYSGRTEAEVKEYLIEAEEDNISLHLEHQAMNNEELERFFTLESSAVPVIEYIERKVLE